ncbi:MAG: VWA domain-containing protein, partial [Lentisphaeria bacterium]|nr:VWA domain-containing protein [Lentisphaeria bacterium]
MRLIDASVFYWLPVLIPAVVVILLSAHSRRQKILRLLTGNRAGDPAKTSLSTGKRALRQILLGGVILLLLTAAARPWWGTEAIPYSAAGRDLLILFDVSKSMLATDVAPSRLKHAQYLVKEIAAANRGDRFGLIAFAGGAFLECPLTTDLVSFDQYVDELSPETIPTGGTNLESALRTASRAFEAAEGNFRAVILISDGDELSGDARRALEEFRSKKIPLFVIGLGDPEVPALVPEPDGSYKRDASGELVRTKLAESQLRQLALDTGGIYVRSTAADPGIGAIDSRIKALMPEATTSGVRTIPVERFPVFLAAALFLLM